MAETSTLSFMRLLRLVLLATLFLPLTGCSTRNSDSSKSLQSLKPYVPPDGAFAIKAPQPPEARGVGNEQQYTFYGFDMRAPGPLLTVRVSPKPPEGMAGAPPEIPIDVYEKGYRAEPGAVVAAQPISMGSYAGREINITAGRRAPLRIRICDANSRRYWLEWNPTIAGSTEVADTFVIP